MRLLQIAALCGALGITLGACPGAEVASDTSTDTTADVTGDGPEDGNGDGNGDRDTTSDVPTDPGGDNNTNDLTPNDLAVEVDAPSPDNGTSDSVEPDSDSTGPDSTGPDSTEPDSTGPDSIEPDSIEPDAMGDTDAGSDTVTDAGPDTVCEDICTAGLALNCPNDDPDMEACVEGCQTLPTSPCGSYVPELYECTSTATFECGVEGTFIPVGCAGFLDGLTTCFQVTQECGAFCELLVPLGCSAGPPDTENCMNGCGATANSACVTKQLDLMLCLEDAPGATCSATGFPTATGCESLSDELQTCLAGL